MLLVVMAGAGCAIAEAERAARADYHLTRARLYMEYELPETALLQFELALDQNPKLVEALLGLGDFYRYEGELDRAAELYRKAVRLRPKSFDAQHSLGLVRQLEGQLAKAVARYLRALVIRPDSFVANHHLAGAYLQMGEPGEARVYAERAVELDPESQAAWATVGTAYSMLGMPEDAVNAYRQAVELGEMAEPVLLGLADAHLRLGHFEQAVVVLESLEAESPSVTLYERLGLARFKMRRYGDALASYRRALAIDGDDVASLNGLGVCLMTLYLQSGRAEQAYHDEALDAWRRSIQHQPGQARIVGLLMRYRGI